MIIQYDNQCADTYHYYDDTKEVKVGNSPKLLIQILRDEIPKRVLKWFIITPGFPYPIELSNFYAYFTSFDRIIRELLGRYSLRISVEHVNLDCNQI